MISSKTYYEQAVTTLKVWNKLYEAGEPAVSDEKYDDLYFQVKEYEERMGIAIPSSPTQNVGYKVVSELHKVTHEKPMLSLDKTKDMEELKSWIGQNKVVIMPKLDGLSMALTYEGGRLIKAETRGDGTIGEDVTHNMMVNPTIPKVIPTTEKMIIHGEVIIKDDDFEQFSDEYANSRNLAAGSIRLLDSAECAKRHLTFIPWDIVEGSDSDYFNFRLYKLEDLGFDSLIHFGFYDPEIHEDLEERIELIRKASKGVGYPIDGMVIRINDIAEGEKLGRTNHHFRHSLAFKFYDEEAETRLVDIVYEPSRRGELTPVAIFDPIELEGTTVTRASLHNLNIMTDVLGTPCQFQKIYVVKKNQIIPQVVRAEAGDLEYELTIPSVCPICGGETYVKESDTGTKELYCGNPHCEGKLANRVEHFVGTKGLDIKGISKKTIEKLIEKDWIWYPWDIFSIDGRADEWKQLPGFGEKSVDKIITNLNNRKANCELWQYLSAWGIYLIGTNHAKEIAKRVAGFDEFCNLVNKGFNFGEWEGFGYERNSAIYDFQDYDVMVEIAKHFNIVNSLYTTEEEVESSCEGITFCITGKTNIFTNRDELKADIESKGGKVVGSMSSKVDYLITNTPDSGTAKNKKARELGKSIITEEEYCSRF